MCFFNSRATVPPEPSKPVVNGRVREESIEEKKVRLSINVIYVAEKGNSSPSDVISDMVDIIQKNDKKGIFRDEVINKLIEQKCDEKFKEIQP